MLLLTARPSASTPCRPSRRVRSTPRPSRWPARPPPHLRARHPERNVSAPAHTKHQGWRVDLESSGGRDNNAPSAKVASVSMLLPQLPHRIVFAAGGGGGGPGATPPHHTSPFPVIRPSGSVLAPYCRGARSDWQRLARHNNDLVGTQQC